jgi:putative toxin-antitoxin system antitoxin component (TIGR02293 family)
MTAAVAPSVDQVSALLGLKPRPHTVAELDRVVRAGLPYASMRRMVKHFDLPLQPQVRRFIGSRSTLERREVSGRLSRAESERLARLAGLSGLAEFVWGSAPLAQRFLGTAHPRLDGRTPLEAAESEIGARQVEQLLWSIEHGLPA